MTTTTKFTIIIPARYDSHRFPGKVLAKLKGKEILAWVYERATESQAAEVVIATDHAKIQDFCEGLGAKCVKTAASHTSGTSRLAEAATRLGLADDALIVNLQGDEPMLSPKNINQLATKLAEVAPAGCEMASLCAPVTSWDELENPNCVKVVRDHNDYALYFSRSVIPFLSEERFFKEIKGEHPQFIFYKRHLGIYAYTNRFLQQYVSWEPCGTETQERLEQLRALHNGAKILVPVAKEIPPPGVDTPEDLALLETME